MKRLGIIGLLFCMQAVTTAWLAAQSSVAVSLDDIILDIYNQVAELSELDFEQLQTDLYALHEQPIDLNNTSDEELSRLYFLSPHQIDAILAYADKHPFESLYELRLIHDLADYEIRNLLPFVQVSRPKTEDNQNSLYAREVFSEARHDLTARLDARNIESNNVSDPMFAQLRYRFDYRHRVVFGGQVRRPPGGGAGDVQYGMYLQLRDVSKHLHSLVAGNFQASFGQGLVLAPVFHSGKSMYVTSVGQATQGLRYYGSADGAGLHGAGATMRWQWSKQTRLDVSALYSMKRANDSTWHHLIGANLTLRHKRWEVQATAIENIWSDSIRPYNNAQYNRHQFRGYNQAVVGASVRYNHGWFDAFAEIATTQNYRRFPETINGEASNSEALNSAHWGFGTVIGSRFYPASGVSLIALYRYYSPFFDNALGYAFSETSRLGDENGGYLGVDITRLSHWRFSAYGDVFYFSGPKFGIQESGTIGYDAMAETRYFRSHWSTSLRLRARKKGGKNLYSARFQFDWTDGKWSLRTTADGNYGGSYGVSVAQDVSYSFVSLPLSLRFRLQGFDARQWDNRIYVYEHDVLYSFSIPATYGLGGRAYLCVRWQIIEPLALYFRISETLDCSSSLRTKTDLHLLLRATF